MDAPLPVDEAGRLSALKEYHILDTGPEEVYDDIVRLAAQICGTPMASMTLIDEQRQWFKSRLGVDITETPRSDSFCAHTILQKDIMIIPDVLADARFSEHPSVTGNAHIRFYAGAPLINGDGYALGSLCVIDRIPRTLTAEQEDALKTLANQALGRMELARCQASQKRLLAELDHAQESLHQSETRLAEVQQAARVGSWEMEVATKRLLWSAETFRLFGFDPLRREPLYEEARTRLYPNDRIEHDRQLVRLLDLGEPYQYELRLLMPNGALRWCRIHGQPILDARGRVVRIAGTILDITENMEWKQRVRANQLTLEAQKEQLEEANAELEALTSTDSLTGLLNHPAFQERLVEEIIRAQRLGTSLGVALLDLDGFHFFNDVYGHAVGDMVLCQMAARLKSLCGPTAVLARVGGDEFAVLVPGASRDMTFMSFEAWLQAGLEDLSYHGTGEVAEVPITASVGATIFPLSQTKGLPRDAHGVLQRAEKRLLWAKTGGDADTEAGRMRTYALQSLSGFSMLDALVTAVNNKDRYTRRHSEDVMEYSLMIARKLGRSDAEQRTVAVAALLHDVGKIGLSDAILRKPGKLSAEEFEAVKQHPQMGAIIVQAVPGLEETVSAVLHHHERWDGNGYPFGLRGREIPLNARLMAVADAYSAMTTDRPYRKGMESGEAASLLEAGSGAQWDGRCVEVFLDALFRGQGIGIGYW